MTDRFRVARSCRLPRPGAVAAGMDSGFGSVAMAAEAQAKPAGAAWSLNATIIEACSCTMFCPCYFSTVPSGHGHGDMVEHFCRFNMGIGSTAGSSTASPSNGIKFWVAGDLGADFSKGAEWAEITFEPSVTKQQRDAIATILPNVYPVTWKAFTIGKDARSTGRPRPNAPRLDSTAAKPVKWCFSTRQSGDDASSRWSSTT